MEIEIPADVEHLNISLGDDDNDHLDENQNLSGKGKKLDFQARKLDSKLKKYEMIVKNAEKINRIEESEFLFIGNGGLNNNISYEFLHETFSQFGQITDIIMQKKKSYSFIIYKQKSAAALAVKSLQATEITKNQTPILFYMFPVDRVPDMSLESGYRETMTKPEGLIYLSDYIDESYADQIEKFLSSQPADLINLDKRRVRHYGYEFRYGTSDCDDTKPLTDQDNKMPEILENLFQKMLTDKLIQIVPDQMTVNFYEPGQGIPPHTDNVTAFGDSIISLSLMSTVQMEFRENGTKKLYKLCLEPNSLLVMKGDVRYNWAHLIAERKHDLISTGVVTNVRQRHTRISLTFRKVIPAGDHKIEAQKTPAATDEMKLPQSETEAAEFERAHVHEVYNNIADHFSSTRHSAWPGVAKFIESMEPYSLMLDVGCGNGKYLNLRKDLFCFGCDYSDQLIKICFERNFNCFVSDCLHIPARTDCFDHLISIAVLHHLSTKERRVKALNEMLRVLKPGGRALVTVWAKEQKYKEKESFYISKKSNIKSDENRKIPKQKIQIPTAESNPLCQKFGKEFQKQDLFVAWHYSKDGKKLKNKDKGEQTLDRVDEKDEEKVFLRFYHVFENKELEDLFNEVPNARVVDSYYEQGNWCAVFEKL